MTDYIETQIFLTPQQQQKFANAFKNHRPCTLRVNPNQPGNAKVFLTHAQVEKLSKARKAMKSVDIKFSVTQMKNQRGGFLPVIGALAASLLPFIGKSALAGAASAAASKVVKKIAGKGTRIKGKRYGTGTRILGKNSR